MESLYLLLWFQFLRIRILECVPGFAFLLDCACRITSETLSDMGAS